MKLAKLIWTQKKKEIFLSSVILQRDELRVFNHLLDGLTYEEIAEVEHCGVKKIASISKVIRAKYNVAQLENPDVLEPLPE